MIKFLICFCLFIGRLAALPVEPAVEPEANAHSQHPYHSGLIKEYNANQKFEYKFTDMHVVPASSPNEHQSLPLTINKRFDDHPNDPLSYDGNAAKASNDRKAVKSRGKHSTVEPSNETHPLINQFDALDKRPAQPAETPSAVLSDLSTRVTRRYMNSKRKDRLRSSVRRQQERVLYDHHDQHEICPESSFPNVDLDPMSKAWLAPVLFVGKLSSLSEDYAGRVAATFQVQRVIKTSTVEVSDQFGQTHKVPIQLEVGHQVVLHFVSKPGQRFIPPHCAVFMNSSSIGSLRLEQRYFVYAAPPVPSLQEMHRHSFGSVTYKAEANETLTADDSNSFSNVLNINGSENLNADLAGNLSNIAPQISSNDTNCDSVQVNNTATAPQIVRPKPSVKAMNLVWMNDQHFQISPTNKDDRNSSEKQAPIPMQFIIHYLSAFYAPEPFAKNVSKSISRTLCKKCVKKPQVEGFTGDLRVQTKNKLRLKCKVFGSPQPWVEWYRNGKKLRNKGRISIKNSKKFSKLEIARVESSDSGYYECRAQNVASREPAVARTRVIVVLTPRKPTKPPKAKTTTTTAANLWPLIGQPCPINNFCLNGGVCTFFENVFEYVCQCAPGYRGLRCQEKDISSSVLELDSALKTGV